MRPATPAPEYNRPATASSVGTKSRTAPAAVALSTVASFRFGRREHGGYVPEHQQGRRDQDRQANLQPTPSIAQCRAPGERGGRAEHSTAQHSTAKDESQPRPRFRPGDDHHGTPRSTEDNEPDRSPRHQPPRPAQRVARAYPPLAVEPPPQVGNAGRHSTTALPPPRALGRVSRRGPSGATGIILVYASRARVKRPRGHREPIRLLVQGCCPVAAGPVEAG